MRVLFVYSDIGGAERYGTKKFYSGLGSLSAVLKAAGHDTELLYLQGELSREELLARVEAAHPDLVAFSATTHQYPYAESYATYLKAAQPGLLLMCGGTHPTLVPDEVMAGRAFDIICIGEGEYPLRALVSRLERDQDYLDVANLWIQRNGETVRNEMRPLIANPPPHRISHIVVIPLSQPVELLRP